MPGSSFVQSSGEPGSREENTMAKNTVHGGASNAQDEPEVEPVEAPEPEVAEQPKRRAAKKS